MKFGFAASLIGNWLGLFEFCGLPVCGVVLLLYLCVGLVLLYWVLLLRCCCGACTYELSRCCGGG